MVRKITSAAVLVAVLILGMGLVGTVAAVSHPSLPYNETVSVTNDTDSILVSGENASEQLTVEVYPGNDTSGGMLSSQLTLNAAGNTTDTVRFSPSDSQLESNSEMTVKVYNSTATDPSIETLTVEKSTIVSGGGGFLGMENPTGAVAIVAVLAVLAGGIVAVDNGWL